MSEIKHEKYFTSTKRRFRSAFCSLLKSYEKEKITVNMLCEKSEISRGTFYLYFHNIDDFISDTESYIINTFFGQILVLLAAYKEDFSKVSQFKKSLERRDEIYLLKYFLDNDSDFHFYETLSKELYAYMNKFLKVFCNFSHLSVDYERCVFFLCGTVHCIMMCLRNEFEPEVFKEKVEMIYKVRDVLFKDMLTGETRKKIDLIIKPVRFYMANK